MLRRAFMAAVLLCAVQVSAHADVLTDIADLKADVQAMQAADNIPNAEANTLVNILNGAALRYQQGNLSAAKSLMRSFKSYVNAFVTQGKISAANGTILTDQADAIISQL